MTRGSGLHRLSPPWHETEGLMAEVEKQRVCLRTASVGPSGGSRCTPQASPSLLRVADCKSPAPAAVLGEIKHADVDAGSSPCVLASRCSCEASGAVESSCTCTPRGRRCLAGGVARPIQAGAFGRCGHWDRRRRRREVSCRSGARKPVTLSAASCHRPRNPIRR